MTILSKRITRLISIILLFFIIYLIFFDSNITIENQILLLLLNTIFTGTLPIVISVISAHTYLKNNLNSALLLCCGLLIFGLGSIATGILSFFENSTNIFVTVYNICSFIGSVFLLFASILEVSFDKIQYKGSKIKLLISEVSICLTVVIIIYTSLKGIIPPFVNNHGFTSLRNLILGSAIALYFSSSLFFLKQYKKQKNNFFYWLHISLFVLSLGLFGVCVAKDVGSLLGWAGRVYQYIGSIFFLVSIISLLRTSKDKKTSLSKVMANLFANSEESYISMFNASPNSIFSIDHNFNIYIANQSAFNLFKIKSEILTNLSFLDLLDQPYKDLVSKDIEILKTYGFSNLIGYTKEMVAKDSVGRVFPIEISFSSHNFKSDIFITIIISDITERKLYQDRVKSQNDILGTINTIYEKSVSYNSLNDLAIYCSDVIIEKTNSVCCIICEIDKDDKLNIISKSTHNCNMCIFNDSSDINKIPELCTFSPYYTKVLKQGESLYVNSITRNKPRAFNHKCTKTKSFIGIPYKSNNQLSMICAVKSSEVYEDKHKEIIELLTPTIMEVIFKKRTEDKVKENELLMRTIMDSSSDLMFVKDKDSSIVMVNQAYAKTFGVDINHVIGKNDYELYKDFNLAKQVIDNDRMVMQTGQICIFEESAMTLDGLRTYSLSKSPWRDINGNIIGIVGVAHDITSLKLHESELELTKQKALALVEELKKADRRKNEFLSILSHELRNPLATIMAGLSILNAPDGLNQFERVKDIIQRQTNQLCHLIDDLLEITRLIHNKINLTKQITNINKIISFVAQDYKVHFDDKGITFQVNIETEKDLFIYADPIRITQIIDNLLNNCLKFTNEGGIVNLTLLKVKRNVLIIIKDNGIGIHPNILPDLFEPFVQADYTLDRTNGDLGLGLSIVKRITELHGGSVNVYSEGLGKGSQFTIRLPIYNLD